MILCFTGLCCFHCACARRPAPEELLQHGRTRPYCNRLQWTSTESPQSMELVYVCLCMYTVTMLSLAVVMETCELMYWQSFLYFDAHWSSGSFFLFFFFVSSFGWHSAWSVSMNNPERITRQDRTLHVLIQSRLPYLQFVGGFPLQAHWNHLSPKSIPINSYSQLICGDCPWRSHSSFNYDCIVLPLNSLSSLLHKRLLYRSSSNNRNLGTAKTEQRRRLTPRQRWIARLHRECNKSRPIPPMELSPKIPKH